jgi:hypothetical protein
MLVAVAIIEDRELHRRLPKANSDPADPMAKSNKVRQSEQQVFQ